MLGLDGAGVVAAKGKNVRRFSVGDRVWAYDYDNAGFEAQYVAVDADSAGRIPRRLTLREAGTGAVTGLTALQGVVDHARVRRGETVLIFGATGAVGTLAVQFAALRGARVIATASGKKARDLVRRLGAKSTIDARDRDAADTLAAAAPDGLDVVLAFAGGRELERLLDLVPRGGRVVYPNGVDPDGEQERPADADRREHEGEHAEERQHQQLEPAVRRRQPNDIVHRRDLEYDRVGKDTADDTSDLGLQARSSRRGPRRPSPSRDSGPRSPD